MKYYKVLNGETIIMIGSGRAIPPHNSIELTKSEYDTALAEIQMRTETIRSYVTRVRSGEITLEQIPEEFITDVQVVLNSEIQCDPDNTYGVPDETYHAIIDDYTIELLGGEL